MVLEQVDILYIIVDNHLLHQLNEVQRLEDSVEEAGWIERRNANDHAYFLFAFTRLEEHIRRQSSLLIKDMVMSLGDSVEARAWVVEQTKDSDAVPLMELVELLVGKGDKDYGRIKSLKDDRDKIAHGGILPVVIVPRELRLMKQLYNRLKKY